MGHAEGQTTKIAWRGWLSRGAVSPTHADYLKAVRKREILIRLAQVLILFGLVGLWELSANWRLVDPFITSQPSQVVRTMVDLAQSGKLWIHIGTTLSETVVGFLLGTLGGVMIAVVLWWYDLVAAVLEPYIVVVNSIPKIALGPIFIVWLGSGTLAIVAMALAISVIVTVMMVFSGFQEVDPNKIILLKSFGATRKQILGKIILPSTLSIIISALKVNLGLALVGTIVGEFLVSKEGLGYLIVYGGQVFNMSLVMASVIILCGVAGLLYYGVTWLETKLTRWKSI